jgi:hypothetical protein
VNPVRFFGTLLGQSHRGFVCIAIKRKDKFSETFFTYPDQYKEMHEFVEKNKYSGSVYFCPQLLSEPRRVKENVAVTTCAWADLDTCHPRQMLVPPTVSIETSPSRYQAFWAFDEPKDPVEGESIARRIAYYHSDEGADRSGWDLTQLLRIPGTRNFKYGEAADTPEVKVLEEFSEVDARYRLSDFDVYPEAEGYEYLTIPMPEIIHEDGLVIIARFDHKLSGAASTLFNDTTVQDRSEALFRLEMLCFEAGMDEAEVFQVARDSALNKWRNNANLLWRDVCRAKSTHESNLKAGLAPIRDEPPILSDLERKEVESSVCFVERYISWARTVGDAAPQYHQASAFILLSSMLAGSVVLPTSFGKIYPNLWYMILADSTVTRKSTAMGLAVDLIEELDDNLIIATDGTIEGLTAQLAARPGKVSLFPRDEFTGLMEQIAKKDYMAGMPEFFTHLYDGRNQKRRLRKEEFTIKQPRLVIYAGGIKSRMQALVSHEHVLSGFLPRFVFITAKTDPTKIKPLGPPTEQDLTGRDMIKNELVDIRNHYSTAVQQLLVNGQVVGTTPRLYEAGLTRDAWGRFNQIDQTLTTIAADAGDFSDILLPTYARLSFSILKAAVLIAASRERQEGVLVEEHDIVHAAYYGEGWRRYAQEMVTNVGKSDLEHKINLIGNAIHKSGHIQRSILMQRYHLTSSETNQIVRTLTERGEINVEQHGKQQTFRSLLQEEEKVIKIVRSKKT